MNVAVVIPCLNEEAAIGQVVADFREVLPAAQVVVLDNGSTDRTAEIAATAGARVISEKRRGKGIAVQRLFADVDADYYVLVDGDGTYDPRCSPRMLELLQRDNCDMVTAIRHANGNGAEYRRGHRFGNRMLTWIFNKLFNLQITDALSGYRALSRRFVKSFPLSTQGFEVETDLNVHAAILSVPCAEIECEYSARADCSASKLNTYSDGWRIARRNLRLFRDARPMFAFTVLSTPWFAAAFVLVGIAIAEFLQTGLVARFPSLIAGVAAFIVAVQLLVAGMVMQRVSRNRYEAVRLAYLSVKSSQ